MTPVPLHERERGEKMGQRMLRTAADVGVLPPACELLDRVHHIAMAVRDELLHDDHDPQYLHPGRSALILLQDVEETEADVLSAVMIVDSQTPNLAPTDPALAALLEALRADPFQHAVVARAVDWREQIPRSGDEALAERLVTASPQACRAALAERLDHLRHAHISLDPAERRRVHAEAEAVYLPMAERTHDELARRYRWWCRMFASRHLR